MELAAISFYKLHDHGSMINSTVMMIAGSWSKMLKLV